MPRAARASAAGVLTRRPPPASDARRRGVPEARIVDLLVANGFAHLAAAGGLAEARGLATEALDRWVAAGLAHEIDAGGGRRFDCMEVVNGFVWSGLQGRDRFWTDRSIPTGRRLTRDLPDQDPGGRARIRAAFARRFDLADLPPDAALLLRAPVPLDGPDHLLTALQAEAPETGANPVIDDGRITLRLDHRPAPALALGWRATLAPPETPAEPQSLGAAEAELYLRPVEGFIRVGDRIRELAGLWAEGRAGWDAAVAFRRRLGEGFCMGTVGYEAFDLAGAMDWALDHGWLDCLLGSALLVALCRAHRVPARLLTGHHLYPLHPSNHNWAEVWDEGQGWRPIDVTAGWHLSAGDSDPEWRDVFVGWMDRRIVTERPPRRVTGPMSVRLPGAWRLVNRLADGGGMEAFFMDAESGRTLFTDRLQVTLDRIGPA